MIYLLFFLILTIITYRLTDKIITSKVNSALNKDIFIIFEESSSVVDGFVYPLNSTVIKITVNNGIIKHVEPRFEPIYRLIGYKLDDEFLYAKLLKYITLNK